jgi:hypothetical protein
MLEVQDRLDTLNVEAGASRQAFATSKAPVPKKATTTAPVKPSSKAAPAPKPSATKVVPAKVPATAVPKPVPTPAVRFVRARLSAAKIGIKAGIKGALSAEGIAAAIPFAVLAVADKVAAREAIRKIEIKFMKEGFAKGVAAGAMGWTEEEVALNLLNHVTDYRVQGLGDPAGYLSLADILKLAEAYENYAVAMGYQFSSSKTLRWKRDMIGKGFPVLQKYGYHAPGYDPEAFFEYDFINQLGRALRPTTDSIVEPAIRFHN